MYKISKERHERLDASLLEINAAGLVLSQLHTNLFPYLENLRNDRKYLEYIAIGCQAVEYTLSKIIVVLVHAINVSLLITETGAQSEVPLEIKIPLKGNETLGQLQTVITKHKLLIEIDPHGNFIAQIANLAKLRNECIHSLVVNHGGDVSKAENALEEYVKKTPIESLISEMMEMQMKVNEDQFKRTEWVRIMFEASKSS